MRYPDKPCYVYVISDGAGCVKIGKAVSIQTRMSELQCGNRNKLSLIVSIMVPNETKAYELESYLHKLLKKSNAHGEWFYADKAKDILSSIVRPQIIECSEILPIAPKDGAMEPITVSVAEGARLLSISKPTLYALLNNGCIPHFHLGGRTLIPTDEIRKFVQTRVDFQRKE